MTSGLPGVDLCIQAAAHEFLNSKRAQALIDTAKVDEVRAHIDTQADLTTPHVIVRDDVTWESRLVDMPNLLILVLLWIDLQVRLGCLKPPYRAWGWLSFDFRAVQGERCGSSVSAYSAGG